MEQCTLIPVKWIPENLCPRKSSGTVGWGVWWRDWCPGGPLAKYCIAQSWAVTDMAQLSEPHRGCLWKQKEKIHSFPGQPPRGNMTILNISGFNQLLGTKVIQEFLFPLFITFLSYSLSIMNQLLDLSSFILNSTW